MSEYKQSIFNNPNNIKLCSKCGKKYRLGLKNNLCYDCYDEEKGKKLNTAEEPNIYTPCIVCGNYTRGYHYHCSNHKDNFLILWIGDKRNPYANHKKPNYAVIVFDIETDQDLLELTHFIEEKKELKLINE